jgi:hypothetical protein
MEDVVVVVVGRFVFGVGVFIGGKGKFGTSQRDKFGVNLQS